MEGVCRRRQLLADAHAGSPSAPSYLGAEHYLGETYKLGGGIVVPSLTEHVSRKLQAQSQIMKEKRKLECDWRNCVTRIILQVIMASPSVSKTDNLSLPFLQRCDEQPLHAVGLPRCIQNQVVELPVDCPEGYDDWCMWVRWIEHPILLPRCAQPSVLRGHRLIDAKKITAIRSHLEVPQMFTQHLYSELSLGLDRVRHMEVSDEFPHVAQAINASSCAKPKHLVIVPCS